MKKLIFDSVRFDRFKDSSEIAELDRYIFQKTIPSQLPRTDIQFLFQTREKWRQVGGSSEIKV